MARFKPGDPKPAASGRKKGVKNRTTEEIRQHIQSVVDGQYEKLDADLEGMSPFQRVMMLDKLTKYFLPALAKNDDTVEHSGEININVQYSDDFSTPDNTPDEDEL